MVPQGLNRESGALPRKSGTVPAAVVPKIKVPETCATVGKMLSMSTMGRPRGWESQKTCQKQLLQSKLSG